MARFRINSGSALVDYIIPTAVVGLVAGLALYTLNDDNSLMKFIAASMGQKVVSEGGTLAVGKDTTTTEADWNTTEVVEAGMTSGTSPELEGSEEISCSGGLCTVKVGDYTLTSIPEDISEYIKSTGPAGGEDLIAAMMAQVVAQMEAEADPAESQILSALKTLAETIGTPPSSSLTAQYASNHYLLEYLITGNDPEGRITDTGLTVSDNRISQDFSLDDPQLLTKIKDGTLNANTDILLSKFEMECAKVSMMNPGKDYSGLKQVVSYLQDQALDINVNFYSAISEQILEGTNLVEIQKVKLQSVKDNVASSMEDVTAASIIAAAKGEI